MPNMHGQANNRARFGSEFVKTDILGTAVVCSGGVIGTRDGSVGTVVG